MRASTSALHSSSLRDSHCCDPGGGGGEDGTGEEGIGERKDEGSGKRGPVLGGARDWARQKALSSVWPWGTRACWSAQVLRHPVRTGVAVGAQRAEQSRAKGQELETDFRATPLYS